GRLHGFLWVFDVTDLNKIQALSAFDVSELDSPWSRAPGRFGAHQFREKLDSTLVHMTWFAGGLRIIDVADPFKPKEIAHYIPEPVNGEPSPQSNDVDVDRDGLIYVLDRNAGFDILEMTGS
ncbi:MAG: LVIVD repeat-containing protein, partial [Rhodospirillales bacterium]